MIGKILNHYQISEKLGAGGMGALYRARDQKLGRDVAIKVLPEGFAKDTDRVAGFQREARLPDSLKHPNIAAIHGLEESEGTNFFVLELVEGQTLADRMKTGPIPAEEALKLDRRAFIKNLGAGAAAISFPGLSQVRAQATGQSLSSIKALVFDVFGTIVDWRGSIIEEGIAWGKSRQLQIDWARFADAWRAGYGPAMNRVRTGELPWTKLDDLHRMILEQLLKEFRIEGLTEEEKDHWNRVWHRLKPWPDCVEGLTRLKRKYVIAPLSNGNIALMTDMAKRSGLPWDAILGAELVRHYKPDREVYLSAADFLGVKTEEIMMVAAHSADLKAARDCGLRSGFIYRPNEFGVGGKTAKINPGEFDVVANDAIDLARQMAA